jgi:hypothetical protein
MKKPILEKEVEAYLNKKAAKAGRQSYKFTSPQRRSVPDRLTLGDIERATEIVSSMVEDDFGSREIAEAVMAEAITFIECKRPGGQPTEAQTREHEKLRARGFRVLVVDSKEMVDKLYGEGK